MLHVVPSSAIMIQNSTKCLYDSIWYKSHRTRQRPAVATTKSFDYPLLIHPRMLWRLYWQELLANAPDGILATGQA